MLRSLVGSEMCIRGSVCHAHPALLVPHPRFPFKLDSLFVPLRFRFSCFVFLRSCGPLHVRSIRSNSKVRCFDKKPKTEPFAGRRHRARLLTGSGGASKGSHVQQSAHQEVNLISIQGGYLSKPGQSPTCRLLGRHSEQYPPGAEGLSLLTNTEPRQIHDPPRSIT